VATFFIIDVNKIILVQLSRAAEPPSQSCINCRFSILYVTRIHGCKSSFVTCTVIFKKESFTTSPVTGKR
jgi:hypothetical protein